MAAQQSILNSTVEAYWLSNARDTKGIDNYLSVLDTHRFLDATQQGLVSIRLDRLTSLVVVREG